MTEPHTVSGGDAAAELRALGRADRLAERFPDVVRLLGQVGPADRARVGGQLHRVGPDAVRAAHPETPELKVAITGHGTLSELLPPLTGELAGHGLVLRPYVAPFDGYVFDLSDPASELYAFGPALVLCVLDPMVVLDELPVPWGPADAEKVLAEKIALLRRLAAEFGRHVERSGAGTLVLNTLPLPRRLTAQLIDNRSRARLGAAWRGFNAELLGLVDAHPAVAVVDLDPLVAEGIAVTDARMAAYTGAHLSAALLAAYAREAGHLARGLTGRAAKCLVVDLDETLWGGILGDDGFDGIEVGATGRGAAFTAFQRVVRQIGSQGVLLAAISKNDPEAVRRVLAEHPGMTLRPDDFVRVAAGWGPKHEPLRDLAADLNLAPSAFVFADDSAFERGLIRHELPEVHVVDLDGEPALHAERLLADDWFAVRELTGEDRERAGRYRQEAARSDFLQSFDSMADYLRALEITVRVDRAAEADVPRLSQLTLRTNQFNCTTERLQPAEVARLLDDPARLVLTVRSADRFGDNGLVGALFCHRDGDVLHIDNFVLSCRVFSRGIEQASLSVLLRHARATGAAGVTAAYRASPKNAIVRGLYPRHGFAVVADGEDSAAFRHDLADVVPPPEHIRLDVPPGLGAPSEGDLP